MAPVRDAPNNLHMAGTAGNRIVAVVASSTSVVIFTEVLVEAVLEMSSYLVQLVPVGVP